MSEQGIGLSVEYFRGILADESNNLNKLCSRWTQILEEASMPNNNSNNSAILDNQQGQKEDDERLNEMINDEQEEIFGAIRTTIGQAKLLMSQRFKQFNELIDNCEFNTGQLPTRLNDLSGFWEMISYQVKDVLKKFNNLEEKHYKQIIGEYQKPVEGKEENFCTNNNNGNKQKSSLDQ